MSECKCSNLALKVVLLRANYEMLHCNDSFALKYTQEMVDGSERKPVLRQDTGYMVEKTYLDIAPYLGAFGAYLMPR